MKSVSILSLLLILIGNPFSNEHQKKVKENDPIIITFGSCSNQEKEQKLWDDILAEQPNAWIWLGDNIYGDSKDMEVLKRKYDKQKSNPGYQKLIQSTQIFGVWDDHDYGANDAGKEFPKKAESQQVLLDFLDVPMKDERRKRAGAYSAQTIQQNDLSVKIILLDTRYFRDSLVKDGKANLPNWNGEVLGETQWDWLEKELMDSEADVHIIGSSIQVLSEEHRFEKWANFPLERQRLLNLIAMKKVKNPIFISGDRHIGEVAKTFWGNHIIYEVTSSSLTHGWSKRRVEANQHRVGEMVYNENYGLIEISKQDSLVINLQLKSDNQEVEADLIADFSKK